MTYLESLATSLLWLLSIVIVLVLISVIIWFIWKNLPNRIKRRIFEED